jgi:hypothetical protein
MCGIAGLILSSGGPHPVPGQVRGGGGLPPAQRDEAARRDGQVDPAQLAGEATADGQAVRLGLPVAEIADPGSVVALFRGIRCWRDGFAAWKLLKHAMWHRRHILGLPPAGDVFETLGAG